MDLRPPNWWSPLPKQLTPGPNYSISIGRNYPFISHQKLISPPSGRIFPPPKQTNLEFGDHRCNLQVISSSDHYHHCRRFSASVPDQWNSFTQFPTETFQIIWIQLWPRTLLRISAVVNQRDSEYSVWKKKG